MLEIGVVLPSVEVQRREGVDVATAARHAEEVGLDSVWHGDHLAVGRDVLDATVGLAVAATATRRITIGAGVFVPGLRPLAWAAKQVGSLMWVSEGRLVLGVGSGGGPEQWAAAGVPYGERGRRTDAALELLPDLLSGQEVALPHGPVRLEPATAVPPIWVGNASRVALRRAARFGDGWFPSLIGPDEVAGGVQELRGLRPVGRLPLTVAVGATGSLDFGDGDNDDDGVGQPEREQLAQGISRAYGRPLDEVLDIPVTGKPAEAADQLARYAEAGAHHVVVGLAGAGWREQCTALAEVRNLLRART
jgi:alkanesulfonate monooxygenase SsuD/methylene tetrahydromethanopterin reductase-like flavin-dependent oxidoreductase (luciferase family)